MNPNLKIVDLTHEIPPQQILKAAFAWDEAIRSFPENAIHVGVVDPGVGSERQLIAAEIGESRFVCPDNGLLSVILQRSNVRRVVVLDNRLWWRQKVSNTFHGRDILVPVAASWSLGHDLAEFGTPLVSPLVTLTLTKVSCGRASLTGQVIDIDRFGNVITNIESSQIPFNRKVTQVELGGFRLGGLFRCYSDVEIGDAVALIGSSGRLEIAIRNGSAADELQVECGRGVVVRWAEEKG